MGRCRGPVNRILLMRKKNLCSPFFQNIGGGVCAKSIGGFYDSNGPGSDDEETPEFLASSYDETDYEALVLKTGTGPETTPHTSDILAINSAGYYDTFPDGKPVWPGARNVLVGGAGTDVVSSWVDDGSLNPLTVQPKQVAQPTFTNDQLQSNDQTNAEYTATNVTTAQDETGLKDVASTACTLTATAANGTVIAGVITAASDTHAIAWYVKRKTGTGNIDLTLDNGSTWTTITLTAGFALFTIDQAALTNPQIGIRIVTSGDAVIVGNAEAHLNKTSEEVDAKAGPIFTTTVPVSITALPPTYPTVNHSDTKGPYVLDFKSTGADQDILLLGGVPFLKVEDGGVGSELFGAFDGTWTAPAGWTDNADGTAYLDGSQGGWTVIYKNGVATPYELYYTKFTLTGFVSGSFTARLGGTGGAGTIRTANGVYYEFITAAALTEVAVLGAPNAEGTVSLEAWAVGSLLKLTDQTNEVSTEIAAADDHRVAIAYDATGLQMSLKLNDGSWVDGVYDGSFGAVDLTFGVPTVEVMRYGIDSGLADQKTQADIDLVNYLTGDSFTDTLTGDGSDLTV